MIQQFIKFHQQQFRQEQGAVYLLLVIIVIGAFTVGAIAIDISNVFRYHLVLQKAVDASSVAGAKVIAVTPYSEKDNASSISKIEQVIFDTISLNILVGDEKLICNGAAIGNLKLRCQVNLDKVKSEESVTVKADLEVPMLLVNKLPGYADKLTVKNEAKAEVQPSIVRMILDTSGSMACPADGSSCACLPNCPNSKFTALKNAVSNFMDAFNPERDFLGVSFFALDEAEVAEMNKHPEPEKKKKGYGVFDLNQIKNSLNVSFTTSSTNQCSALYNGFLETASSIPDRRNPAYILFSDGAPSASRFFFANPRSGNLPENNPLGGEKTKFDYLSWLIKFDDIPVSPDPAVTPTPIKVDNPSELARVPATPAETDFFPYNWQFAYPPQPKDASKEYDPEFPDNITVNFNPVCSKAEKKKPKLAFENCVHDLSFWTPDDREPGPWPDLNAGGGGDLFLNYMEQYYNCAIAMSDFIRYKGAGVVYTVGLGTPSIVAGDPYQNAKDTDNRKDVFFKRLANDPEYFKQSERFPFPYDRYRNRIDPESTVPDYLTQGAYLGVNNPNNLDEVFRDLYSKIVRKIKVVQLVPVGD